MITLLLNKGDHPPINPQDSAAFTGSPLDAPPLIWVCALWCLDVAFHRSCRLYNRLIVPRTKVGKLNMFRFLRSNATPIPLRILHYLQLLLSIPAYPSSFLLFLTALLTQSVWPFVLIYPWIFSSFSNTILLHKEKSSTRKGELSKQRYLRLQLLKLAWTTLFYLPLVVAFIAFKWMKFSVLAVLVHEGIVWRCSLWFNVLHWVFIFATLIYASCCFRGQTEGTIRLEGDAPIRLDLDGTADDEAIARQLQANEPGWEV
ncbi:hypothetical protein AOQ84DRAFT_57597 [Glonium stellatum]|uniref:Uncharacterized protein n=1 Tax=Glonium stellatum TaxID=574774 RepID=A0A8E2EZH5_9PEZI|nr:hypothetical protein AOQ84DRAFT_57597 [Glonium stellatum]